MGTLRTIFALSVLLNHIWPGGPVFVGGANAVQIFYIISGFLISYVLVEKKRYRTIGSFYANRYLRLYPIYVAVAILALRIRWPELHRIYQSAPPSADSLLIFSNAFLFGQDWVMFSAVKEGSLAFASNFRNSDVPLWQGLLVPQAWSLGLELCFYVMAPFVLVRRWLIYVLLFGSCMIRGYFFCIGIAFQDPWSYRFFPTELGLFLAGALSHQILLPTFRKYIATRGKDLPEVATVVLVILCFSYFSIPVPELYKEVVLFAAFIALLPFTFVFQDRHALDRWIGDLSYPIYIVHGLVIDRVFWAISGKIDFLDFYYAIAVVSVVVSILCAILLNRFIATPFERIRDKFRSAEVSS